MKIVAKLMHLFCRYCPLRVEAAECHEAHSAKFSQHLAECRRAYNALLSRGLQQQEVTLFQGFLNLFELLEKANQCVSIQPTRIEKGKI